MFTAGWPDIHIAALKERFDRGMSFAQISADINATFGTAYSRNACIGKAKRLGLSQASKPAPAPRVSRPKRDDPSAPRAVRPWIVRDAPEDIVATPIECRRVSLLELDATTCRWPLGTPGHDDFCFCGNHPMNGLPYCAGHCRLAYRVNA